MSDCRECGRKRNIELESIGHLRHGDLRTSGYHLMCPKSCIGVVALTATAVNDTKTGHVEFHEKHVYHCQGLSNVNNHKFLLYSVHVLRWVS